MLALSLAAVWTWVHFFSSWEATSLTEGQNADCIWPCKHTAGTWPKKQLTFFCNSLNFQYVNFTAFSSKLLWRKWPFSLKIGAMCLTHNERLISDRLFFTTGETYWDRIHSVLPVLLTKKTEQTIDFRGCAYNSKILQGLLLHSEQNHLSSLPRLSRPALCLCGLILSHYSSSPTLLVLQTQENHALWLWTSHHLPYSECLASSLSVQFGVGGWYCHRNVLISRNSHLGYFVW